MMYAVDHSPCSPRTRSHKIETFQTVLDCELSTVQIKSLQNIEMGKQVVKSEYVCTQPHSPSKLL